MAVSVLGIDLGKNSCSVVGLDATGNVVERGHIVPQGRTKFAVRLGAMLDGDAPMLETRIHRPVSDMRLRWTAMETP